MRARPIWKIKRKHLEQMNLKQLRKVHRWIFGKKPTRDLSREQLINKIEQVLPACR